MSVWAIFGLLAVAAVVILLPRLKWVSVKDAQALLNSGAVLVDVRTVGEFRSGSVAGAVNIPLGELRDQIEAGRLTRDQPTLVFCASGTRSAMAKRQLETAGFSEVHNIGSFGRARQLEFR